MISQFRHHFFMKPLALLLSGLLLMTTGYAGETGKDDTNDNDRPASTPPQEQTSAGSIFVPGDAVFISTMPDTTSFLNGIFPIDDRGFVELPIYGKAKISHMSEAEFLNFIRENFRDYLRFPNLQVKPMIRLSVLGGVPRPGFYYFDANRSLWEVIYEVGGTLDENGLRDMRWERNGGSIENELIPYLQTGISLREIGFRSGDQIWVRTPTKPGFWEKSRTVLTAITAVASLVAVYITIYDRTVNR